MAIDLNEDYADVKEMHEKMRDVTDLEKTKKWNVGIWGKGRAQHSDLYARDCTTPE